MGELVGPIDISRKACKMCIDLSPALVVGDNESEIMKMIGQLPKETSQV